jgi:single-stranded-DNA-specific exonuclease
LKEISHLFLEFGGHDQAVGGTLTVDMYPAFREAARSLFAERVPRERLVRRDAFEAELPLDGVSPELLSHLESFEPHGAGNPRPIFSCAGARAAEAFRPLGEAGWRGRLWASQGPLDAIRWNEGGQTSAGMPIDAPFRMLYRVSRSGWSGRPEIEIVRTWPTVPEESGAATVVTPSELAVAT